MGPLSNQLHEAFAQLIAQGKSGIDAYEQAGFSVANRQVAYKNASALKSRVMERIRELQQSSAGAFVLTRDWVISEMIDTANAAAADKDHSSRRAALKELGREVNAFTEKQEVMVRSFKDMDAQQIEEFLASERAAGIAPTTGERGSGGTGKAKGRDKKSGKARSLAG